MNIKAFKRLIKEAVAEALYEQLPEMLEEHMTRIEKPMLKETKTMSFTSNDVQTLPRDVRAGLANKMGNMFGYSAPTQNSNNLKVDNTNDNPYLSFIEDAANNMDARDVAGLRNMNM